MSEEKKVEQTSSKIDSSDHVFYSDDSVFTCYVTCNNLQYILEFYTSAILCNPPLIMVKMSTS